MGVTLTLPVKHANLFSPGLTSSAHAHRRSGPPSPVKGFACLRLCSSFIFFFFATLFRQSNSHNMKHERHAVSFRLLAARCTPTGNKHDRNNGRRRAVHISTPTQLFGPHEPRKCRVEHSSSISPKPSDYLPCRPQLSTKAPVRLVLYCSDEDYGTVGGQEADRRRGIP